MKRLLVVADHSLVIHSIRLALRQTAGFQVAGFVDGRGPITGLLERHQPEVVLLDDMRLRSDALDRLREIATVLPDAQTVLLTTEMDDEWVAQAFEAGARTVISKSVHPVALGTLLREVAHGNIVHRAAPPVPEHVDTVPAHAAGARDPAAGRRGADQRHDRPAALGDRADGQVPPVQHLSQARRDQPHRSEPIRVRPRSRESA